MASNPTVQNTRRIIVGKQAEKVPVTTYVDGYYWTCGECGWLGTGWTSQQGAMGEAALHFQGAHGGTEDVLIECHDVGAG